MVNAIWIVGNWSFPVILFFYYTREIQHGPQYNLRGHQIIVLPQYSTVWEVQGVIRTQPASPMPVPRGKDNLV